MEKLVCEKYEQIVGDFEKNRSSNPTEKELLCIKYFYKGIEDAKKFTEGGENNGNIKEN